MDPRLRYIRQRLARWGGGGGGAPSNATCTLTLADSADPVITGGDAFSYTATVSNTSGVDATSLSLAVTLDASLTYVSATGTGWSISQSGGVVTCTLATLTANSTANAITINVTTGNSAVSASSSGALSGANFTTVNTSQGTTVQLVTKDATLGWYLPANNTELASLVTRKGLAAAITGSSLWNLQEASGSFADSVGSAALAVTGSPGYQQTKAGVSRFVVTSTDASTVKLNTTATPNTNASSLLFIGVGYFPSAPAASRNIVSMGSSATQNAVLLSTGKLRAVSSTNNTSGANVVTDGTIRPIALKYDHTNSTLTLYSDAEKLSPTFLAASGASFSLFSTGTAGAEGWAWGLLLAGAAAEITDAQLKAMFQAMGPTITWT